jgi:hypothetical protein
MKEDLPELKIGEWQFANNYTAIWIHVPNDHLPSDRWLPGLVRIPISETGRDITPVWKWDGNKEAPTLTPSIDVHGVWHGFLTNGKLITA